MRAFIFSLDAFVAFTLALVAIYSLIFFSSVPSSYYYILTQGHYLSRDVLMALSTTTCATDYGICVNEGGTLLDNIAAQTNPDLRKNLVSRTVGDMVPEQFGYVVEMSGDAGQSWKTIYDTSQVSGDKHARESRKLTVSSQVISFGYSGSVRKLDESPFKYNTCGDALSPVITCGDSGKTNPSDFGDLVPSPDVKIIRLTVFI